MLNDNKKIFLSKSCGVTLMELLATISIISILLLMGLTKFDEVTKIQKVNNAVQQASFAIKQARHYSRIKGVITELTFPTSSATYSITAGDKVLTDDTKFDSMSGVLPEGTKIINNTCGNIYFYVDGTPINSSGNPISSDCTITLGYANSPQKTLTLKTVSGNVEYEK